jgi:ankyrin repeat protein
MKRKLNKDAKFSKSKKKKIESNQSEITFSAKVLTDHINDQISYLPPKQKEKVIKELKSIKTMPTLQEAQYTMKKAVPEQYEYMNEKKIFEYAFPEKVMDDQKYNDLHGSWYSDKLINKLLSLIRSNPPKTTLPLDTKILLLDSLVAKNGKLFDGLSKNELNSDTTKVIIIRPLLYNNHWHTVLVQYDPKHTKTKLKVIFDDPYGLSNINEETKSIFIKEVKAFFVPNELDENIKFDVKVMPDDSQGYNIDSSNCGPITLHTIESYLLQALCNEKIENYTNHIVYDQFKDHNLNQDIHKALMLRLRVDHLTRVEENDVILGFSIGDRYVYDSKLSQEVAKKAKILSKKIKESIIKKYTDFLPTTEINIFDSFKLLNLLAISMLKTASLNIINPLSFSQYFANYNESSIREIIPKTSDTHELFDNIALNYLSISDLFMTAKTTSYTRSLLGSELIKVVKENNVKQYDILVNLFGNKLKDVIDEQDSQGNTALIYAVLTGNQKMVQILIDNGADIYIQNSRNQIGNGWSGTQRNALEISAFQAENIEIFKILLNSIKNSTGFIDKLTNLLNITINTWVNHPNHFESYEVSLWDSIDLNQSLSKRGQIIDILLSNGADPFKSTISDIIIHNIPFHFGITCRPVIEAYKLSTILEPSLVKVFLKHFPSLSKYFLFAAIENENFELIKLLCFSGLLSKQNISKEQIDEKLKGWKKKIKTYENESYSKQYLELVDPKEIQSKRISKEQLKLTRTQFDKFFEKDELLDKGLTTSNHIQFINAVIKNNLKQVKDLIENDKIKNINMFHPIGYNALFCAIKNGDLNMIKYLIGEKRISLDVINIYGIKPELFVIQTHKLLIFKYFLEQNIIFPNSKIYGAKNPDILSFAISYKAKDIVKYLMTLKLPQESMQEALMTSIWCKDTDIIELLISKGVKIDKIIDGDTPLIRAIINQEFDIVKMLIDNGADCNVADKLGTPLEHAVRYGYNENIILKIVKILLDNDATTTVENPYFYTILETAIDKGRLDVVKILLKYGANVNEHSQYTTPLKVALNSRFSEKQIEILKEIVNAGVIVDYSSLNNHQKSIFEQAGLSTELEQAKLKYQTRKIMIENNNDEYPSIDITLQGEDRDSSSDDFI